MRPLCARTSQTSVAWAIKLCAIAGKATDRDNFVGVAKAAEAITTPGPPHFGDCYVDLYAVGTDGARNAVDLVPQGGSTA